MSVVSAMGLLTSHTHTHLFFLSECPLCSRPASFSPSRCKASPSTLSPSLISVSSKPQALDLDLGPGGGGGSQPLWPTDECMGGPRFRTEAGRICPGQWHPDLASRLPKTSWDRAAAPLLAGGPTNVASTHGVCLCRQKRTGLPFPPPAPLEACRLSPSRHGWARRSILWPRPADAAGFLADLGQTLVFCLCLFFHHWLPLTSLLGVAGAGEAGAGFSETASKNRQ